MSRQRVIPGGAITKAFRKMKQGVFAKPDAGVPEPPRQGGGGPVNRKGRRELAKAMRQKRRLDGTKGTKPPMAARRLKRRKARYATKLQVKPLSDRKKKELMRGYVARLG